MIYNGEFKSIKIHGSGVTAALLKRNGIQIYSEENLPEIFNELNS